MGTQPSTISRTKRPNIAVVGASGIVGTTMRQIISERADVWGEVRLLGSRRSAGRLLDVRGAEVEVGLLEDGAFDEIDIALFDVPDDVASEWAQIAVRDGALVIDNSGAFRMEPDVPLVVPEVNPGAAQDHPRGIISNPNCTTLSMIVAVAALHRTYGLSELVVASYQSASGMGQAGVETLRDQLMKVAGDRSLGMRTGDVRAAVGEAVEPFNAPLVLNLIPWAGSLKDGGWSSEELKVRNETRKILGIPSLSVSATCVRVPVVAAHSLAVHATFERKVDVDDARQILANAPGVVVYDDPAKGDFPTPADVVGTDPTWVGRIRRSLDNSHGLDMFIVGDNLRKGAALNAIQIAELVAATT